jgi:excisionase family DNA binding protein
VKTYTTGQLAKRVGVGRDTIYRWMRARKIKAARVVRVASDVAILVRRWTEQDVKAIKKFMKQNYRKGRGRKPKPKP